MSSGKPPGSDKRIEAENINREGQAAWTFRPARRITKDQIPRILPFFVHLCGKIYTFT
jgi:hypothetical protein